MTYTDSTWLLAGPCPSDPDRQHLVQMRVESTSPIRLDIGFQGETSWHACGPRGGAWSR